MIVFKQLMRALAISISFVASVILLTKWAIATESTDVVIGDWFMMLGIVLVAGCITACFVGFIQWLAQEDFVEEEIDGE